MVFHADHDCDKDCKRLTAYIRVENRLTKIGHFGTECKQFEPLDLQKEAEDKLAKTRQLQMDFERRQTKRENKERLDIMRNQFVRPNRFISRNYADELSL